MRYEKPEVVLLANALELIQCGTCKLNGSIPDGVHPLSTANAYEVDE
jgi:hypothetical protein